MEKNMTDFERRHFLQCCVIGLPSIVAASGCHYFSAKVVVPILLSTAFSQLVDEAKRLFRGNVFQRGITLAPGSYNLLQAQDNIDQGIANAFDLSGAPKEYSTPISLSYHGHTRYLQLRSNSSEWSLISGGKNGSEVFMIHDGWLRFLLEQDHCNLRVNGHSIFNERCGVGDCPVTYSRQDFLDVPGKHQPLRLVTNKINSEVYSRHVREGHSVAWKDCSIDTNERPEKCP